MAACFRSRMALSFCSVILMCITTAPLRSPLGKGVTTSTYQAAPAGESQDYSRR